MTGRVVWRPPAKPEPHDCEPPMAKDASHFTQATEPVGTLWRCDCGRLWRALVFSWRRASWREQLRARYEDERGGLPTFVPEPTVAPPGPSGVSPSRDGSR